MTVTITVPNNTVGQVNVPVHVTANITSDIGIKNIEYLNHDQAKNFSISLDQKTLNFTPPEDGRYSFLILVKENTGAEFTKEFFITVGTGIPVPTPTPVPTPVPVPTPTPVPTGEVLFDSHIHSKLHDGKVRTITQEGIITACGNGVECRASGSPKITVNADNTFSLWDNDLGRFYGYTCNYDSIMELECAFWDSGDQTNSLKLRSRHNEGGDPVNRFGGYGFAVKSNTWDSKREDYHNVHTSMGGGSLPTPLKVKQYFKIRFTVKDDGSQVKLIGEVNGVKVMDTADKSPKPYMLDKALYAKQSYYWVRQNTTTLAELRIKSLRILKA